MGVLPQGVLGLRVGLVIYGSLDNLSGGFLYDRKLVDCLKAAGDEVQVIGIPWRNYGRHLTDVMSRGLRRELMAADVDVMLQDELNHPSLFRVNRAVRGRRPIISIVHHLRLSELRARWKNRAYSVIERSYLRSVDGFVFNSETTRDVVYKQIGSGKPHVVAVPAGDRFHSGITAADINTRAMADGPLRILFLGNVIERKQLHVLLEAMTLVGNAPMRLDVVGGLEAEPEYAVRMRRQVEQLGLHDSVTFHGPLLDNSLRDHLAASHVLAVPSSYEGFGIVYLEGMAFGLPAIATDSGAAHEIITNDRDGFLIPMGSAQELSIRLRDLVTDRDQLANMGAAALKRFARHPTWEQSMTTVREFLLEIVEKSRANTQSL